MAAEPARRKTRLAEDSTSSIAMTEQTADALTILQLLSHQQWYQHMHGTFFVYDDMSFSCVFEASLSMKLLQKSDLGGAQVRHSFKTDESIMDYICGN